MSREALVKMFQPVARALQSLSPNARRGLLAAVVLLPICAWVGLRTSCVGATPPEVAPPAPVAAVEELVEEDAGVPPVVEPPKTTATVTFIASPSVQATVTWGRKRLGIIKPGTPLTVVRPRDSGPLDVVVKADGYLPVHTRAHTFNDQKMIVKLTKPEAANTLLGYRIPIEAGIPDGFDLGDAGVPPSEPAWP